MNLGELGLMTLGSRWVRCAASRQAPTRVDRENRIIRGFSVATVGEALGHGIYFDSEFLDELVAAGNKSKAGLKSRFDHPNASSTSMGTVLGRAKNFTRDGNQVRADLHLLDAASNTPSGDLAEYVMSLAEEDPGIFGTSVVVMLMGRKSKDGKDAYASMKGQSGDDLRLVNLKKFMAVDIVDDPAANPGGMFSSDGSASELDLLAAKATEFLDRYFQTKGLIVVPKPDIMQSSNFPAPDKLSGKNGSIEHSLEDTHVNTTQTETTPTVPMLTMSQEEFSSATAKAAADAVAQERARIVGIQKRACSGQESLVAELIEKGVTLDEAKDRLIEAFKASNTNKLAALVAAAPASVGGGSTEEHTSFATDEDRWNAEWEKNEAVREEFYGNKDSYIAFQKREAFRK